MSCMVYFSSSLICANPEWQHKLHTYCRKTAYSKSILPNITVLFVERVRVSRWVGRDKHTHHFSVPNITTSFFFKVLSMHASNFILQINCNKHLSFLLFVSLSLGKHISVKTFSTEILMGENWLFHHFVQVWNGKLVAKYNKSSIWG